VALDETSSSATLFAMRRATNLICIAVLVLPATIATSAAPAAAARIVSFQTPSRNIGCAYLPVISTGDVPFLRCEIRSGLRPLPRRPRACGDAVWGQAVAMTRTGRARGICISDTIREPSAPVLGYGRTRRVGGFTCTSTQAALRCTNRAGHGWRLSRARSSLF
jgi:hypothetical protein